MFVPRYRKRLQNVCMRISAAFIIADESPMREPTNIPEPHAQDAEGL